MSRYAKRSWCSNPMLDGEMTERPKVHDWKSCVRKRTVGSNPTLSATARAALHTYGWLEARLGNKLTLGTTPSTLRDAGACQL